MTPIESMKPMSKSKVNEYWNPQQIGTMSLAGAAIFIFARRATKDDREPSAIRRRTHCWLEGSPLAGELGVRPTSFESRIYWEILQRWNEQRIGRGSRLSGL